jgi:hypothetical protein
MAINSGWKSGPYYDSSREEEMYAYDRLPKEVREIIANAPTNGASVPVGALVTKHGLANAVKILRDNMREWIKYNAKTDFGPDHPQAR